MMTLKENQAFTKDLHKLLKKHGLTLMYSKNPEHLVKETKHLDGYHMFFTKGERKPELRVGESIQYQNTLTIRFSKPNTEDDGC